MAMGPLTTSRRAMLGATLAAVVPDLAFGQKGRGPASQKPTRTLLRQSGFAGNQKAGMRR
ncbi:hypothetical protein [Microvirga calopogonii]|uniref:hypothetical protein n=1 Tax=Microvirga calopogonii TaxID=2078013 RepID=UPI00197C4916|nr:hypothetical protein [Microvirga calopogonii]